MLLRYSACGILTEKLFTNMLCIVYIIVSIGITSDAKLLFELHIMDKQTIYHLTLLKLLYHEYIKCIPLW